MIRTQIVKSILDNVTFLFLCAFVAQTSVAADGSQVRIRGSAKDGYQLYVNEEHFVIRGVGGTSHIELLASCGGNAIRTWDAASAEKKVDGKSLLDHAYDKNIFVTVGLWLGHERHGFRYDDPNSITQQRDEVVNAIKRLKNHPALLCWGLGNEMEGPDGKGDSVQIWKEVNTLASLVKKHDPDHPVMTVVANVNDAKLAAIKKYAPLIDILGVNVYSGSVGMDKTLRDLGWEKPYCVSEYGPPGPWEVASTTWKAPLEPSSRSKASTYFAATSSILDATSKDGSQVGQKYCLGGYAFLWGHKQETTATWFGMLLPTGEKTLVVDAMTKAWTGSWPRNRAPILQSNRITFAGKRVGPGEILDAHVEYRDPDSDDLSYIWEIVKESTDRKIGGDAEKRPDIIESRVIDGSGSDQIRIQAPQKTGGYRLFVTVRDGHGSGCSENWPFFVSP